MLPENTMLAGSYDYRLVLLSVVIATCSSYAALDLAGRITVARGWVRLVWLAGGASSMGLGIWSTHYIGMLAFRLPIPVWYDWPIVLLSLSAAIFASAAALHVASGRRMSLWHTVSGSLVMGGGIGAMHYIGMHAMLMRATCHFNLSVVALSVILAVGISFVAIRLVFLARNHGETARLRKIASAIVMGAAIPIMHYTGMAAASFTVSDVTPDLSHAVEVSTLGTIGIAAVTIVVLGIAILTTANHRLAQKPMTMRTSVVGIRIRALRAAMFTFCMMFVFEEAKQVVDPNISIWTSHTVTILFATLAAAALGFTVLRKEERSKQVLQNSENKYRVLFEDSADANWLMDEKGFVACNSAALQMFGYPPGALMRHPADISPPNQPDGTLSRVVAEQKIAGAFLNGKERFEWLHQRKNGDVFPAEVCLTALTLSGQPRLLATVRDITERKQAEEVLLFKTALLEAQTETTIDGILVVDDSDHIVLANKQFGLHFGIPDELLSIRDDLIVRQHVTDKVENPDAFIEKVKYLYSHRDERSRDEIRLKNGKVFDRYSAPLVDSKGRYRGRIWYFRDITDQKLAEERVQFLAYYDALTGLPSRTLLQDRLAKALAGARRQKDKVALLFLDLDGFKDINDSLGHAVGDLLLQEVAERLKTWGREQDTVARLGGDEFLIMLTGVKNIPDVAIAAERLMDAMTPEFVVQGHYLSMSCSLGISIFPEHGVDSETLIKNADAAMYSAKDYGRNNFRFFTEDMNAQAVERLTLENSLRLALDKKELFLVYQPQMDIATGRITGLEALLRWQHPELGLVSPDRFIRIAENSGLIVPIGEWVLRTACSQARKWQHEGLPAVSVAVNVSAVQFRQEGFCKLIGRVLHETTIAPQYLELELTEGLLLASADLTLSVLRELRAMGVTLAIDDFGTGYSSLSYLKQFPVSRLKIDPSFIRDVAVNPDDAAITIAIISMARSLHLKVIAEGVENEAQMSFLRAHHCDEIQGYYFSKPLTVDKVPDKLRGDSSEPHAKAQASGAHS